MPGLRSPGPTVIVRSAGADQSDATIPLRGANIPCAGPHSRPPVTCSHRALDRAARCPALRRRGVGPTARLSSGLLSALGPAPPVATLCHWLRRPTARIQPFMPAAWSMHALSTVGARVRSFPGGCAARPRARKAPSRAAAGDTRRIMRARNRARGRARATRARKKRRRVHGTPQPGRGGGRADSGPLTARRTHQGPGRRAGRGPQGTARPFAHA